MWALISRGISLGFTAGVLPGPFQSYIIGTTLMRGWRQSIVIICSPLVIDIPIILLVVFILGSLPSEFIRLIQLAGGLFLLWIARETWIAYRAGASISQSATTIEVPQGSIFRRGLLMNLLSPGPYLFWSTVNGPLLIQALEQSALHGVVFLAAFYGTFLSMLAATVLIFDRLRHIDPRVTRGLLLVLIVILVWFGVSLILEAAQ